MITKLDLFTINMSKIGHNKVMKLLMTIPNLAFLLAHPLQ
jgi:hypothetical protein